MIYSIIFLRKAILNCCILISYLIIANNHVLKENIMIWNLERPKPALPNSYFWTWDHSTNWVLDDPGIMTYGCHNRYLKQPETFVEDYRRLTDLAAGLGVKGIVIWGFLRESHGGIEAGKKVADYAASKGVAIMPGVGTNWYGGCFYEGNHKYNIETFLKKHPDAGLVSNEWRSKDLSGWAGINPTHPLFVEWLQEGVRWLFKEFTIGGVNLENGDFIVDYSKSSNAQKENWQADDPDFFRMQFLGYNPAFRAIESLLPEKIVTWATYTGFISGESPDDKKKNAYMRCRRPALLDRMPNQAICQWTLSDMLLDEPLPLIKFLDEGMPEEVFANPHWQRNLKNPAPRGVGFAHQGSQWNRIGRYDLMISTIKEACLRAYRSGLEGVSIHGELTSRHIPAALNYLAFSHFIHFPEDTLRDFGRKTLGQVLRSEDEGEEFIEILANWDCKSITKEQEKNAEGRVDEYFNYMCRGQFLEQWKFWRWLQQCIRGNIEKYTTSFF